MKNGKDPKRLGSFTISQKSFEDLDSHFKKFDDPEFKRLNEQRKHDFVNRLLYELILDCKNYFLLREISDYISRIRKKGVLKYYAFSNFELWLNQFSAVSHEENAFVRGKIMGKKIPRDEFQIFFPIGMNKYYEGTHFVTAHGSPDLDTTIASFWGWADAFTARIGDGLHIWNLPGGPPLSQIEIRFLFQDIFGADFFDCVAKKRTNLTLSSYDLMKQNKMIKKHPHELALSLDHERNVNAIVITDDEGYYLGDWRHFDVEGVRQVIMALYSIIRFLENEVHQTLINLFAQPSVHLDDLRPFLDRILNQCIGDYEPIRELTLRQQKYLQDFLEKILLVEQGLSARFENFIASLENLGIADFGNFMKSIHSLENSDLFDKKGALVENRPEIFSHLKKIFNQISESFRNVRSYVERLEVALKVKSEVFGFQPQYLSYRADIEEIRTKIINYPYLTVNYAEGEDRMVPVGIVQASDIQKSILGTVTVRDFCNRDETKIPPYLEIISVIDHHKSVISTLSPPVALISDVQSSNTIVAEYTFKINDRYSTGGLSLEEIKQQIASLEDKESASNLRIYQRLLAKKSAALSKSDYHVSHEREYIEYLHFLYAILDDTDLLTKVSRRDVECVCSLLNRLKSLSEKKEVESVHFDAIDQDVHFVQNAAKALLQNKDLYSLYSKTYQIKEEMITENLERSVKETLSTIFSDVKVQNGLARIGQIKLFANNIPFLQRHLDSLRKIWYQESERFFLNKPEIDLHMQMVSTLTSAEELFSGKIHDHKHKDQLWIWAAPTELGTEHLRLFLNNFKSAPHVHENDLSLELLGGNSAELRQIFKESFLQIPVEVVSLKEPLPIAVLYYNAGTMNSRKAMISPYLPPLK